MVSLLNQILFLLEITKVCNQGTGFECVGCNPGLICNDIEIDSSLGIGMGACCNNFVQVIDFTRDLVNSLSNLPVDRQRYSIVGFGNSASVAVQRANPEEVIEALDELIYSGGRTNHGAAITSCRTSLPDNGNKDIILLITDGDPSEPGDAPQPQESAQTAADLAKADDIFIIPIMIIPDFTTTVPEPLSYLEGISSDGTVFSAADFQALDNIQESVLKQVSCQV